MKSLKIFNTKKETKKELRQKICNLAYSLGVNSIRFSKKAKYIDGSYNWDEANIFVNGKMSKYYMLVTFFHELAHHVASSQNKWKKYHMNASTPLISPSKKFDIENKIDKIAQKLWYKYVSTKEWGRYRYGYKKSEKKELIEWLKLYY
jgi:hypothetical protein